LFELLVEIVDYLEQGLIVFIRIRIAENPMEIWNSKDWITALIGVGMSTPLLGKYD
jgi:hypothetical protein